jgi:DNA polymerase
VLVPTPDSPNENATPFDNVPRTKQPLPPVPVQSQAVLPPSALPRQGAGLALPEAQFSHAAGDSLTRIASEVAICARCPLYQTATNPVPGEGNPQADLMCVGEAPGATEDETGRPFVGAAGHLLTKILEAIRLPRDQVFICNVLKHRPPGNRNPLPEEVIACSPFLVRQIELVRPKVILALGSFAAQSLLQSKLSLGKLRGQIHQYHGVPVVVTYHPAALLRNPSWKRPTWEDVQLARRILDSADQSGA